jgi:hypothetical protein
MAIENTTVQGTTMATPKKRGWVRKLFRFALITGLIMVVGLFMAHVIWKMSGSGKWQLALDKDGVQVYTMKVPGSTLKHFKAVGKVKTSLQRVMTVFTDSSMQHCHDIMSNCLTSSVVVPWNANDHYWVGAVRAGLPKPFAPRELVMKDQFSQDPQTKTLFIEITAAPDLLPPDNCCVRITQMDNKWRWTPLKNGEFEVEVIEDMDVKLPYILWNARTREVWKIMSTVQQLMDRKQGPDGKFDFLQEPETEAALQKAAN